PPDNTMPPIAVRSLADLDAAERARLHRRSELDIAAVEIPVRYIVDRVRLDGDAAVLRFTAEFDKVDLTGKPLRVAESEFDAAERRLSAEVREAILFASANIAKAHRAQLHPSDIRTEIAPGVLVGERTLPLDTVALYVPRGKGSFPSVVMMLAIPAIVAGVARPLIVTPPSPSGEVDDASLFAARTAGVTEVYRVGGAQAIAALAFGTQSIPRVPKVLGPGNIYVSAAKRILYGTIDPGIPAGPSEAAILADAEADPDMAAHDLLIESEHGPDSTAILVTPSRTLAETVARRVPQLIDALPEPRRSFCTANFGKLSGIYLTRTLDEAIDFVNELAPEHLELLVADPFALLDRIRNAGEVLMGAYTPIVLGNFCAGSNAILPTGGLARSASCLGVADFQKRSSYVHVDRAGFARLGPVAATLADYEGFPAHAAAVRMRAKAGGAQ
ncbi:MAG: histidinol dehydrogenase, partial [Hyphomicrobiaceae bacterium]